MNTLSPLSPLTARSLVSCLAALSLAVAASGQVRVSQPIPTDAGSSSAGMNPDSGAGPATPPAEPQARGGALGGYQGGDTSGAPQPPSELTAPDLSEDSGEYIEGEGEDTLPRGGYDPEGRRDPFRPLTGEAADSEQRAKYEGTLQGRLLAEVRLTSIVRTPRGNIATFEGGPKKEGYFARVGDKFWDGQVIDINYDTHTVVVRQQLNDPRLIKPYRDQVIALYGDADEQKRSEGGGSD